MQAPDRLTVTSQEIDTLIEHIKNRALKEQDYMLMEALVNVVVYMGQLVDEKAPVILRQLRMLFGKSKAGDEPDKASESSSEDKSCSNEEKSAPYAAPPSSPDKPKPKGHGRNGASDYPAAEKVAVSHECLRSGGPCPLCPKGKLHSLSHQIKHDTGTPLSYLHCI